MYLVNLFSTADLSEGTFVEFTSRKDLTAFSGGDPNSTQYWQRCANANSANGQRDYQPSLRMTATGPFRSEDTPGRR